MEGQSQQASCIVGDNISCNVLLFFLIVEFYLFKKRNASHCFHSLILCPLSCLCSRVQDEGTPAEANLATHIVSGHFGGTVPAGQLA